jgi:PKHD-type hydroxylase
VRRADQREILFELEQVRSGMSVGESSLVLDKTIGNLIRMWGGD